MSARDPRRTEAQRDFDDAEFAASLEEELEKRGVIAADRGERILQIEIKGSDVDVLIGRPVRWSPRVDRRAGAELRAEGGYSDSLSIPFGGGIVDFNIEWGRDGMQITWETRDVTAEADPIVVFRFVDSAGIFLREPVRVPFTAGVWPDPYGDPGFVLEREWHVEISSEAE